MSGSNNLRVLFVSHVQDTQGGNGGAIYTKSLINALQRCCGVDAVRIEFVFASAVSYKPLRVGRAAVLSVFGIPLKIGYFRHRTFRKRFEMALSEHKPQIIFFDHLEVFQYCTLISGPSTKTVLVQHNVESALHKQRVSRLPRCARPLAVRDARRYEEYERAALCRAGEVVAISAQVAEALSEMSGRDRIEVIAPSFNYSPTKRVRRSESQQGKVDVAFVANFAWWPNREAINWFLSAVYPHVTDQLKLHLIGRESDEISAPSGVVCHGFLTDIREVWSLGDVYINPILSGSGVNVKVAEAVYNRAPMLSTPFALRGLQVELESGVASIPPEGWVVFIRNGGLARLRLQEVSERAANKFHISEAERVIQRLL